MKLTDFPAFFEAVNGGHRPFQWQTRLMTLVAETGRWPDQIAAPTGSGKSSVVDIHLFANALYAAGAGARVPRRLSVVVNRRGLVDQHAEHARAIRAALTDGGDPLLQDVAAALRDLATPTDTGDRAPFLLAELRGELAPDRDWLDDPSRCAIICATPDMWGSRLLLRGYGSSRYARPREAGMLAYDSVLVLDEAHLNRQLLVTARRVAQIAGWTAPAIGVDPLRVVETTATPASDTDHGSVGVLESDLDVDVALAARLRTPKPVRYVEFKDWPTGKPTAKYLDALVAETHRLQENYGLAVRNGGTVGCVVNRVDTATEVAARLRKRGLRVELKVGRMRPYDTQRLLREKPGLLTADGDPDTDVLVATQTVEVGVDIDLSALVTELAPGSSLAQRAGRVNRRGLRTATGTEVVVFGPAGKLVDAPPYFADDLTDALAWLHRRADDPAGLAPLAVAADPPPAERQRRAGLQRLEQYDAWTLARTNDALFDDPDLELWLRDDLTRERATASIVVRADLPEDDNAALALLEQVPPAPVEEFPCDLPTARALLSRVVAAGSDQPRNRVFLHRTDEITQLTPDATLRRADVLVVDDCHLVHTEGVAVENPTERAAAVPWAELGIEEIIVDPEHPALADYVDSESQAGNDAPATVGPPIGDDSRPSWLVRRRAAALARDPERRQTWSPSGQPVPLASHAHDVSIGAKELGRRLGIAEPLLDVLVQAGLHHDDGKLDPRFQLMLRGRDHTDDEPLAKSGVRREQQQAARAARTLPLRWRHEQLSVLHTAAALQGLNAQATDLVLRLVGTSHGRGRPGFPHTAAELLETEPDEHAIAWFDTGRWDTLVERTDRRWGVWGCAYLEALLRSADGMTSRDGR